MQLLSLPEAVIGSIRVKTAKSLMNLGSRQLRQPFPNILRAQKLEESLRHGNFGHFQELVKQSFQLRLAVFNERCVLNTTSAYDESGASRGLVDKRIVQVGTFLLTAAHRRAPSESRGEERGAKYEIH